MSRHVPAVLLLCIALAGCGRSAGGDIDESTFSTPTAPASAPTTATTPSTSPGPADPLAAAGKAATRYALAARSWTPDTYHAQYRTQVQMAVGRLRSALLRSAPTAGQIRQYRDDDASLTAQVLSLKPTLQSSTHTSFVVRLFERSVAAGQNVSSEANYAIELVRRGARWRVQAFSVQP